MNYTNSLMRIWVEVGAKSSSGTAFPISGTHILTAAHLFDDDDSLQSIEEINALRGGTSTPNHKVFLRSSPFTHDQEIEGSLVWHGKYDSPEKFDVAIVAVAKLPAGLEPLSRFSTTNPVGEWSWETAGFSEAGKRDVNHTGTKVKSCGGTGNTWPADTTNYALEPTQGSTDPLQWMGGSGGPVVNNKTLELVGVQSGVKIDEGKLCAYVVPLARLIAIESFVKTTGYDALLLGELRGEVKSHVQRLLSDIELELCQPLLEQYLGLTCTTDISSYAEQIVSRTDKATINGLIECHRDSESAGIKKQQHWEEIIDRLLPIMFPAWSLCSFITQVRSRTPGLVQEPFATDGGVVLGIFAESGKRPKFKSDSRNRAGFSSRSQIFYEKAPPEDPDSDVLQFLQELMQCVAPDIEMPTGLEPATEEKELASLVEERLSLYPTTRDGRAFCILRVEPQHKDIMQRIIAKLHALVEPKSFPLIFIALCPITKFHDVRRWENAIPEWLAPRIQSRNDGT